MMEPRFFYAGGLPAPRLFGAWPPGFRCKAPDARPHTRPPQRPSGGFPLQSLAGIVLFVAALFYTSVAGFAQTAIRDQINRERQESVGSFFEEKTLEKARKFIRQDSTYYVGHMLEGAFLFFRANDELGFNRAIAPLQKAMDLIEKDFNRDLRTRSSNFNTYARVYPLHFDYGLITYFLNRCYQNVERQEEAMRVLYHVRDRNLQMETATDSYNTMAWIYHRNRMYTSERFSFLKNSVTENVAMANKLLDSAIRKLKIDLPLVNGMFDPTFLNRQYLSTFYYKAMIHDYLLDIDSATLYYNILLENNAHSSNNYAHFKMAMGEFEEAEKFFRDAEVREQRLEKSTKEYFYMRGTLETYRGQPQMADTLLSNVLREQGSTPGYGWHCIGLARARHYEGLTAESRERITKAARFQELHIGTTWGQEQYNLAVASLQYLNHVRFRQEFMFENDEWYFWLNPLNWFRWLKHTLAIRHHKMILANLVAENPEREQVLYSIFSPENLINFDEVYSLIDGFGTRYFISLYERRLATDKRPNVKKYYRYYLGKLHLADGDEEKARSYFESVLNDEQIKDPFESLLLARTYEGLAHATEGEAREEYLIKLYQLYPQLLPYSGLPMSFRLSVDGPEELREQLEDQLNDTELNFTDASNSPQATVSITAHAAGGWAIRYRVELNGETLQQGEWIVTEADLDKTGRLLAYRFMGIYKNALGEELPPLKPVKEKEAA